MKKLKNKMLRNMITQWVFQISICVSSIVIPLYLNVEDDAIVAFGLVGITVPIMFWFLNPILKFVPVVFSVPKPVLTDHGYFYVTLRKCVGDSDYAIRIYSKFYLLGGICIYDSDISDRYQYIDSVTDTIEEQVNKFIRVKELEVESLDKDFNEWDGMLTDRKEVLRDHTIDEIL